MNENKANEPKQNGSVALSVLVPLVRPAVYAAALLDSLSRALGDGAAQAEVLLVPLAPGAAAEESLAWRNNSSKLWSVRTIEDGPQQRGVEPGEGRVLAGARVKCQQHGVRRPRHAEPRNL